MNDSKLSTYDYIMLALLTILYASFTILSANTEGIYVMIGISIIALIILLLKKNPRYFKIGPYQLNILLFALFCFLSSLWAISPDKAEVKARTIVAILICLSIFYFYFQDKKVSDYLLLCIVYGGVAVGLYSLYFYGYSQIVLLSKMGMRLDTEFANVNNVALACTYSIFIATYFLLYKKQRIPFYLSIWTIIIIAGVASRKAVVSLILGIALLILYKSKGKDIVKTSFKLVVACVLLIVTLNSLQKMDIFKSVNERMEGFESYISGEGEMDSSTKKRSNYIKRGFEVWKENPILGVGIDSSAEVNVHKVYFHNNYAELLACGGIIGILIFYNLYFYVIAKLWKYRKIYPSESFFYGLYVFIILMNQYGQVVYYSKETYLILMIFYLHILNMKKLARSAQSKLSIDKYHNGTKYIQYT